MCISEALPSALPRFAVVAGVRSLLTGGERQQENSLPRQQDPGSPSSMAGVQTLGLPAGVRLSSIRDGLRLDESRG